MVRVVSLRRFVWRIVLISAVAFPAQQIVFAQTLSGQVSPAAGIVDPLPAENPPASNHVLAFTENVANQSDGTLNITFSIYPDQQSSDAVWTESQNVQVMGGKYSTLLGSTTPSGLPAEIFAADHAHWLGVRINGAEKRYLLVSVPYAQNAVNAEQLGGLPASQYATMKQLQSFLRNSILPANAANPASGIAGQSAGRDTAGITPDASTNPPQPATDFRDNNASEVLLVTQQGTGFAIHAISSGDAALFAENSNTSGTAIKGSATATTGHTIGIFGTAASPDGIPGVFDNAAPGRILSLRSNAIEVARFDQNGLTASQISAGTFTGSGSGLTNIPISALPASSSSLPLFLVTRDINGDFAGNRITASTFAGGVFTGDGSGLTHIPLSALPASSSSLPLFLVSRDNGGSFAANQITASTFVGSGAGLTNIPISALPASSSSLPGFLVARDNSGNFAANQITASTFVGSGAGLTALPPAVVTRDSNGNFNGNQIMASLFTGSGAGLTNIPAAALPPAVVTRDSNGSFGANQIIATLFTGSGAGLTNIPVTALPPAVVTRDSNGNFGANQIIATLFTGSGAGLTNIPVTALPPAAVTRDNNGNFGGNQIIASLFIGSGAGLTNIPVTALPPAVVTRDSNGNFGANQIIASLFTGSGAGLSNIPVTALPPAVVTRDSNGNFGANQIFAAGLSTGNLNASGFADFTTASKTAPIRAVLSSATPTSCLASKELLIKTDALAGQQLFICNSSGDDYVLVGDGAANGVTSITAGDSSIRIGGTSSAPTVAIATGGISNSMLQNSSVNIAPGAGLSGGGNVSLGGSISLSNAGVLSFNGRAGDIAAAPGDYAFNQISGSASPAQLPASTVYSNQGNTFTGDQIINGKLTASTLAGDGSGVSNVNAATLNGVAATDLATNAVLNSESNTRQSADAALQANINAESASRQSDVAGLQTSINSVSTAGAKLAASNTFTAGTQDFSAADATLPVHAVPTAQVPATCVANKELLIETDAPGGQQLFICNATGNGWNLVGDGATGGVASFHGRSGSVTPAAGDYSFDQISGSVAASQLPAFSGDITSSAGSTATTLSNTGVIAGTFTKVTVDAKGRATAGQQAAFADLAGTAGVTQLPATIAYNNQSNTFTADQTVTGSVNAVAFNGNGAGLTNVNAVTLNGLASASFARLATPNTFAAKQTLVASSTTSASLNLTAGVAPSAPAAGDVWNTGTVVQYRDSASTTRSLVSTTQGNGMQMLKVTASITPSSIAISSCSEQSFSVSGVNSGDVLLVVQQPSTTSPGTSIAIGGWRIPANNTVAIQFCNVSRGSSHTPAAGTYTFAIMR
jgi:hypothetical protein